MTARNAILSGGYLLPHYISVSIYLVACEQALLGVGGGRGKEDPPPKRACSQAIYLGELAMLEVITVTML